jgi:hypothetical protein
MIPFSSEVGFLAIKALLKLRSVDVGVWLGEVTVSVKCGEDE